MRVVVGAVSWHDRRRLAASPPWDSDPDVNSKLETNYYSVDEPGQLTYSVNMEGSAFVAAYPNVSRLQTVGDLGQLFRAFVDSTGRAPDVPLLLVNQSWRHITASIALKVGGASCDGDLTLWYSSYADWEAGVVAPSIAEFSWRLKEGEANWGEEQFSASVALLRAFYDSEWVVSPPGQFQVWLGIQCPPFAQCSLCVIVA